MKLLWNKKTILEKGDRIRILKEDYGNDNYLLIRKTKDDLFGGFYYELFDEASSPAKFTTVDKRKYREFEDEISEQIKSVFEKYSID